VRPQIKIREPSQGLMSPHEASEASETKASYKHRKTTKNKITQPSFVVDVFMIKKIRKIKNKENKKIKHRNNKIKYNKIENI
jgi:hypothetical protein